MNGQKQIENDSNSPANSRWLLIALGSIGTHQVQSFLIEPNERIFRIVVATFMGLTWMSRVLPNRVRGVLWMVLSIPVIFGSFAGHLVPIVRERRVPPASETAPFNLAGSVLLFVLGAALALPSSSKNKSTSKI